MLYVTVENGVRCAVQDLNPRGRRTILFVHGWPMNERIFESQYAVLPEYGIRCIGLDLRGFGASDKPLRGYNYDCMADDLHKVITEMDLRGITLCGFSMGGAICVRYLSRYRSSGRVGKLVLMGAAVPSFVQRPGYPYGMTNDQVDALIAQAYENRPQCVSDFTSQCFYSRPGERFYHWIEDECLKASGNATIKTAEALRDEDLRSDMQRVRVPTAIFHGVHDQVCPFDFAGEMNKGITNSFVVPFEHSGHCLFHDEKNKCNASLIDFVNS